MIFDKPSSWARTGSVLSALVIAAFLFAGSLTTIQPTVATTITEATTITPEEEDILDTQDESTENLSESDRDVNGIEFTPRWGGVSTLEPNQMKVLFADCLEDEFAVSYMYMFETEDVVAFNSFPWAFPDNHMSWIAVVENTDTNNARVASIGVICADENSGREDDVDIDIRVKNTIQNTVNNIINIENNQITNLNTAINVYNTITQNAYQIAVISGNNNTVSQVIEQTARQIVNANTTNTAEIQQAIDQSATQAGVISGGGSLSQDIDQGADQAANVTGGGAAVDQDIDQGADQAANVTDGFGGGAAVDQDIDQGADQAANVTDGFGGGAAVDQDIDQGADQAANVEGGGGGGLIDQAIGQRGQQAANVTDGFGGGAAVDQDIDQDADQAANVTGQAANVTDGFGGGAAVDQDIDQGAGQAANGEGIFGGVFG